MFTVGELLAIEDSARTSLLDTQGHLRDPEHWLGLVIDLSRSLRREQETRLGRTIYFELPT